jgi:inner membrane protein
MDNLTHSLVGALLGQMGLKRKTGLAMPTLIIAANIPDIDAVAVLLGGHQHLALRRGLTHGPIAMVLLPLLLWAGMLWFDRWQERHGKRPEKRLPVHKGWLLALAFLGCLSHPLFDWFNSYGIRLLEPFSSQWFYGDTLFIIDVWIWAALILGVCWSLRLERGGKKWRWPAISSFFLTISYIVFNLLFPAIISLTYAINEKALIDNGRGQRVSTQIPKDLMILSPPPIMSWQREIIIGKKNDYFRVAADSTSPSPTNAVPITKKRCEWPDVSQLSAQNADLRAFLFWSRAPFAERAVDGSILIHDARFYSPLARNRFTVALPSVRCIPLPVSKPIIMVSPKNE